MRVATWNVNSLRQRLPRFLPWLDERRPDVACLQETKLADAAFDELLTAELADRGYAIARHGQGQWNGVARYRVAAIGQLAREQLVEGCVRQLGLLQAGDVRLALLEPRQ